MKFCFVLVLCLFLAGGLCAQTIANLAIEPGDVRMDQSMEGGYLLHVRAKPGIRSIILTESTADPRRKMDSYTLRSKIANPVNSAEKRMLDGKFIESPGMYFLLSSTVVVDQEFGSAFRIFIPYVVLFGYPSARYGEIAMTDGAYLNLRSFAKPYADYSGAWKDNPYTIKLAQKAGNGTGLAYNKTAIESFTALSVASGGVLAYSKGDGDLISSIKSTMAAMPDGVQDLAFCLDATVSLANDAPFLRRQLSGLVQDYLARHPGSRVGIVQFRDYMEDFLYKITPFGTDLGIIQEMLDNFRPEGGRDTPEAVDEALYAALTELDWTSAGGTLVLVGDAPPHPMARGSVTREMVAKGLKERGVRLQVIILPD